MMGDSAPLSRRSRAGSLVVRGHNQVARSPLRWVCGTRPVLALVHPFTEMTAADVLTVAGAVAEATDRWWIGGGWGVDALVGRQTRKHVDLDLVISDDEDDIDVVVGALTDLGLHFLNERHTPGYFMPRMIWLADSAGHSVELYPVNLGAAPFLSAAVKDPAFTRGTIGGEPVPCMAAWLHVKVKNRGYRWRRSDRHDLRLLDSAGDQPVAAGPTS
jgi:lincosamide nucleotidyltransferase A/C/D/E